MWRRINLCGAFERILDFNALLESAQASLKLQLSQTSPLNGGQIDSGHIYYSLSIQYAGGLMRGTVVSVLV